MTDALNLAITLSITSPFLTDPSSLSHAHPALYELQYTAPVGALSDVLMFALPRAAQHTPTQRDDVVQALKGVEGVLRVDVLERRTRTKRDEF